MSVAHFGSHMTPVTGDLGDSHELSERARRYANEVVFGEEWPLTADHVDLDRVTFETSTRMRRRHGVCSADGADSCTLRLSERTYERAGFSAIGETVRHELVHVYQHQSEGVTMGHGPSFERWVDPLDLSGRCSDHYAITADDYAYSFHCERCGFIGGRYRMCKTVEAGIDGGLCCRNCESREIEVRDARGVALTDRE